MSLTLLEMKAATSEASDRLLIFLFFLAGAFASFFGPDLMTVEVSPRLVYAGMMGMVILLSASCLGYVLLPICSFIFGVYSEISAMAWVSGWREALALDGKTLLCSMVLIPVFFLSAIHGLNVSSSMLEAIQRGSPTVRSFFRREVLCVLILVLFGCAAIFYFYE